MTGLQSNVELEVGDEIGAETGVGAGGAGAGVGVGTGAEVGGENGKFNAPLGPLVKNGGQAPGTVMQLTISNRPSTSVFSLKSSSQLYSLSPSSPSSPLSE